MARRARPVLGRRPRARRSPRTATRSSPSARDARRHRRHRAHPRPRRPRRGRRRAARRARATPPVGRGAPRRPTSARRRRRVRAAARVVATPGHAPDHLAFVAGARVLHRRRGPRRGQRLRRARPRLAARLPRGARAPARDGPRRPCPGHGPLVLDPDAKLDEYIAHRLDRERRLDAALADGLRTADELLDRVWADAPAALRGAATVTLAAHLDKLAEEGRLPDGVERPQLSGFGQV